MREALQRLERTGLVEVSPNRYTRVSVADDKVHADTHEFVVYLMGNAVRVAAARGAPTRCSPHALEHADAIIAASRADDHPGIMAATARFFDHDHRRRPDNVAFITVMHEAELAIRRNLAGWHPLIECPIGRTEGYVALPGCRGRARRRRAPRRSCASCTA